MEPTPEILAILQQHGGMVGVEAIDPYIEQQVAEGYTKTIPNRNPKYRFWARDGTYLDARPKMGPLKQGLPQVGAATPEILDSPITGQVGVDILGGTALKTGATDQKATLVSPSPKDKYITAVVPDGQGGFKVVTQPNPEYDPKYEDASVRAAMISAAQSAANRELQERLAMIEHDLEERKLSLDEAIAKANEEYKRIDLELQKETNRLTERGQEVTMRGQDLNFASNIADTAADLMKSTMPFMAPKGTAGDLANLMNSFATGQPATVGVRSAPMPFDPSTWVQNQVAAILKGLSPTAKGIYYAGGAPFPTGESASPAFQAPRPAGVVNPQLTLPPKMFQ